MMDRDRILNALGQVSRRARRACLIASLVIALVAGISSTATAIVVGATNGIAPNTAVNPASYGPDWTLGDPGWANAAKTNNFGNAVYLGDGWLLGAFHVDSSFSYGVTFGDATSYERIPGQSFQLPNPSGIPLLTSPMSDLQLFRVNAEPPGVPSLLNRIVLPQNTVTVGEQVMFIGHGNWRKVNETHWTNAWQPTTDPGYYAAGYELDPVNSGKSWGTNNIANDNIIGNEVPNSSNPTGDPGYPSNCNPNVHHCDQTDSDNNRTIIFNHTVANLTQYDRFSSNKFEAQVVGGDSGSGVYRYRNGQWELAGILLNLYGYPNQPSNIGVYGTATAFADLSAYHDIITSYINSHQDYSLAGDLNLDGASGTSADIAAFVAGWGCGTSARPDCTNTGANMASWKKGDLDHDGDTDFADFLKLRTGITASAAAELGMALSLDLGPGAVPEPSSILLVLGPGMLFALKRRKRHCSPAV